MKLLSVALCLVSASARTAPWERKTSTQENYVKINLPDSNHLPGNHLPGNHLPGNHLPSNHLPGNHLLGEDLQDTYLPNYLPESQNKYVRPLWFEGYQGVMPEGYPLTEPVPLAETAEQYVPQIPFVPQPSFAYGQPTVPVTMVNYNPTVMDQSVPQYAPQYVPQPEYGMPQHNYVNQPAGEYVPQPEYGMPQYNYVNQPAGEYVPQPEYGMPQYNYVNPPAGQYVPQPEHGMPQYNYVNPPAGQYVPQPEYGMPQYNYVNPTAGISVPQHAGPAMSMR